jgi:hypothetical protein
MWLIASAKDRKQSVGLQAIASALGTDHSKSVPAEESII